MASLHQNTDYGDTASNVRVKPLTGSVGASLTGIDLTTEIKSSEADALRALTLEPAKIFRIDDRIGSLESGKDADFIVLDGPPLDWESRVRDVFIEGVRVLTLGSAGSVGTTGVSLGAGR